ncbi:mandelate racemase/muconate lactonizing enzyme family protein [Haladaptatus caseinilyticus]|uniref:mandelate racemase/muconate lactonizing enzyme family protein n=1 Tax=Haladaptatus caseinilyticus TaxID=2993314 RepID=UPI00224B43CE|nr:dipeptide epimerase [Haladaptatus caseinilyticus]
MRIERVTVHQYDIPLEEPFVTALKPIPELERVLIEIETDVGITGLGEAAPAYEVTGETQRSTAAVIEDVLAPLILDTNPLNIERIVGDMAALVDGSRTAHAGIELALQDIRGKAAEMPLYQLLGGNATEPVIDVPKVLSIKDPDEMVADAIDAVEAGYEQIKIKVGSKPETDIERVKQIAAAVPESVSLKADANQGWGDAKTALCALREITEYLDVIEQPVVKENVDDLIALRDRVDIPVMPDESVETASDCLALVNRGAGDIYNIKLMKTGGIEEAIRVNTVAEADDRPTQIGSMVEGGVGTAAGVHFCLAFENVIWNEMVGPFMTTANITNLDFSVPEISVKGPGFGVEIDRDDLDELRTDRRVIERQ